MPEENPPLGSDEELRRLFTESGEQESGPIPSFAETLGRRPRPRVPRARPLALAASLAVVLLVAVLLVRDVRPRRPRPPDTAADIGRWKSPTDFLLRTPGIELFDSLPSVFEPLSPPAGADAGTNRKGART